MYRFNSDYNLQLIMSVVFTFVYLRKI